MAEAGVTRIVMSEAHSLDRLVLRLAEDYERESDLRDSACRTVTLEMHQYLNATGQIYRDVARQLRACVERSQNA